MQVFGLWNEIRVPEENPFINVENMQTQPRKTPGQEGEPATFQLKADPQL